MGTLAIGTLTLLTFALVCAALVTGYLWFLGRSEREGSIRS
jgi:hypothetical protein